MSVTSHAPARPRAARVRAKRVHRTGSGRRVPGSSSISPRVIADNPVLLELKKLDALKEIAERIDVVKLMVGTDGLESLVGSKLLSGDNQPACPRPPSCGRGLFVIALHSV